MEVLHEFAEMEQGQESLVPELPLYSGGDIDSTKIGRDSGKKQVRTRSRFPRSFVAYITETKYKSMLKKIDTKDQSLNYKRSYSAHTHTLYRYEGPI